MNTEIYVRFVNTALLKNNKKAYMELKFKRLNDKAIMPIRAHKGDAGLDLTCTEIVPVRNGCNQLLLEYRTGLAVEIPEGHVGLLFPRSSVFKTSLILSNCVGVIDSNYRGEIKAVFRNTTDVIPAVYQEGERFCQLVIVPIPEITITEASELSETERGDNGYGSTGTTNDNISAEQPTRDDEVKTQAAVTESSVAEADA